MARPINQIGPRMVKMLTAAAVMRSLAEPVPTNQGRSILQSLSLLTLNQSGIVLRDKLNGGAKTSAAGAASGVSGINGNGGEPPEGPIEKLEKLGLRNITREAREGRLDPVFERSEEMAELSKRLKGGNNALLIGDTGVGKSAIVEGLAQEWKDEEKTFFMSLGMKDLDRSVLEPQLKQIVETTQEAFRQGFTVYILMDELHLHEQAGVLELLKEPLARPGFQVIGATTTKEFYQYFNNDATKRRFGDPLKIEALTGDKLRRLVRNIIPVILERLKGAEKIEVPPRSRQAAIDLSPLIIGRFAPDATIALLKEAIGSKRSQLGDLRRVVAETPQKLMDDINDLIEYSADPSTRSQIEGIWKSIIGIVALHLESEAMAARVVEDLAKTGCLTISEDDIRARASKMSGLDLRKMDELDIQQLTQIEARIRTRFIGQDQAVEKVAGAIKRYKTGRRKKQSPVATFLFTGPTGTGKTEMAHTIAWLLFGDPNKVMTIDMTLCEGRGGKSLLFGPDPGFVGFDKTEGMLPELLKRKENRHGVLLLDEIDKADREVYESLLNVLDKGYVQNKKTGEKYSLEDIVVIMGSNQGEAQMVKPDQMKAVVENRLIEREKKLKEDLKAAQERYQSAKELDPQVDTQNLREIAVLQGQLDDLRANRQEHRKTILQALIDNNRQIASNSFRSQTDDFGREKYPSAFLNRLEIVPFDYLNEKNISAIADIQLKYFISQVERDQKLELMIGENEAEYQAVKAYLLKKGTDLVNGARPLKTAIETHLDNPFSAWLINETPSGEYIIKVSVKGDKLVFEETKNKSERGRQMDISHLRGRKGAILRTIREMVENGKAADLAAIKEMIAPPKGKAKLELWFEEKTLPEELTAALESLASLMKTLGAEDLERLKKEDPELLLSENPALAAFVLYLAGESKNMKFNLGIHSLTANANPVIAGLAKLALEKLEGAEYFRAPHGSFLIPAADKSKVAPEIKALLAGMDEALKDDREAVRAAVNTFIYVAKERQEKLEDESKKNIPITVSWEINPEGIKISVVCAGAKGREEESRLKQLKEKYAKAESRNIDDLSLNIYREIPPESLLPFPDLPASITEAVKAIVPGKYNDVCGWLSEAIKQIRDNLAPAETLEKLDKEIAKNITPQVNPDIKSLADLLAYNIFNDSHKVDLLNSLLDIIGAPHLPDMRISFSVVADNLHLKLTVNSDASQIKAIQNGELYKKAKELFGGISVETNSTKDEQSLIIVLPIKRGRTGRGDDKKYDPRAAISSIDSLRTKLKNKEK